ncbi:hypothetical protein D3C74_406720 [compost metagenome]
MARRWKIAYLSKVFDIRSGNVWNWLVNYWRQWLMCMSRDIFMEMCGFPMLFYVKGRCI